MPEFLNLQNPDVALSLLLKNLCHTGSTEWVDIFQTLGRISALPVIAENPLPSFRRSTVDGYAVRAVDTYGASESMPVYLRLNGEVSMGVEATLDIPPGNCALIHTGGMVPETADAVVMLEYTQADNSGEVEIIKATAPGENIIRIAEDVAIGQEVIPAGRRIRPVEIGGLAALGVKSVAVTTKPRVAILSSGDEVIPLEEKLHPGQVYDVNSYSLSALIEESGGKPIFYGILPDQIEILEGVARKALEECDMVVFTAGSSASARDLTAQVINGLGVPGTLIHGVNVRPGKPTILGVCGGKAVVGLPGNPVSAMVIASLFLVPIIERHLGLLRQVPKPSVRAKLTVNLASQAGREDWIPVLIMSGQDGILADPIFGKSNLIFTLVRADGYVRIPADSTGFQAGEDVEVLIKI